VKVFTILIKGGYFSFTRDWAFELIKRQNSLAFKPNTKWDYSNTGYLLMEYIIERVTKMPFGDYLKLKIFDPLGMKDTVVSSNRKTVIPNAAYGYTIESNQLVYTSLITNSIAGAGGIQMTHEDMLKFDRNFYNNKLPGGQDLIKKITTPGRLENGNSHAYGYGLIMSKFYGHNLVSHDGAFPGFLTSMLRFPDSNMTVFMTSNIYDTRVYTKTVEAAKIYLDIPLDSKETIEQIYTEKYLTDSLSIKTNEKATPSLFRNFNKYVGYYHSAELKVVHEVKVENQILYISVRNLGNVVLVMKNELEFWLGQVNGASGKFFLVGDKIVGFEIIDFPRAPNLLFRKLDSQPIC
jgi:CubicO group peptidase (beta-lactamase class C family)